ncbi:MAG TPA: OB-fold nucleic acid binding domain-containing protein, partial [Patescibacteria group bacterium]
MDKRILASDTPQHIDQEIVVKGFIHVRRDHGKLIFFDLRDSSGLLQVVVIPSISEEASKVAAQLRPEDVVEVHGLIKVRPEKLVNAKIASGTVELSAKKIIILSKAETLPFDMGGENLHLELPTLLDYRSLTLRHKSVMPIFKVQAAILEGFRK